MLFLAGVALKELGRLAFRGHLAQRLFEGLAGLQATGARIALGRDDRLPLGGYHDLDRGLHMGISAVEESTCDTCSGAGFDDLQLDAAVFEKLLADREVFLASLQLGPLDGIRL